MTQKGSESLYNSFLSDILKLNEVFSTRQFHPLSCGRFYLANENENVAQLIRGLY